MSLGHAASERGSTANREWTLPAAAGLAAVETTVLITIIALGSYPAGPVLIVFLALKYAFCWALLHRRPGAWMALMLWEASGAVAALARPGLPGAERIIELGVCVACMVLLGAATPLFPSPRMPPR